MFSLNIKIEDAITGNLSVPWVPNLTRDLVESKWQALADDHSITPQSYSSARIIDGSISASRHVIGLLPHLAKRDVTAEPIIIESLPVAFRPYFDNLGITLSSDQTIALALEKGALERAFDVIGATPSLLDTVVQLVRVLHLLDVDNDECDVSFSDPKIPFSIFVSVPPLDFPNASLRLAEAIVHEAMHLQLTFIESHVPLVQTQDSTFFSPWKNSERSASGILHALYVFTVIYEWLQKLPQHTGSYALARQAQIRSQVNEIHGMLFIRALSPGGQQLCRQLFAYFNLVTYI